MTKKLSVTQLTIILLCNTIGTGVFFLPKIIVPNAQTALMSLFCWFIAGFISILFGLCYSELGSSYPCEGGDTIYLTKAYGSYAGILFSLISVVVILPLGCALMAKNIVVSLDFAKNYKTVLVMVLILTFSIINYLGSGNVYKLQVILTALKMITVILFIALAGLVFIGLIQTKKDTPTFLQRKDAHESYSIIKVFTAVFFTLWSYDGWNSGNFIAHRVAKPYRTFPLAITISLIIVTGLYILINLSYFYVLPSEAFTSAGGDIITEYFGALSINASLGGIIATCINVIPPLGTMSGSYLVFVSIVDSFISKRKYPNAYKIGSLAAFSATILVFYLIGDAGKILDKINFFVFLFYGASVLSIFILRKKAKDALKIYRANTLIVGFCGAFSALVLSFALYRSFTNNK